MIEPLESLDRDLLQQYYEQVSDENNDSTGDLLLLSLQSQVTQQQIIEDILLTNDCIKSEIPCLDCARTLVWTSQSENDTEIVFSCADCLMTPKLLRCDLTQSGHHFMKLISTENIQLVSSALNLILLSSRYINALTAPAQLENPIDILYQYREQLPNGFKFGGDSKSIVVADLHEIGGCQQYPVLIISDTKMVPTRYYLHAMHFLIDCQEKQNKFIGEYLFNELTAVGNMVIKEGSFLVLGPNLQNWITADMYAKGKHNLQLVVPFDHLKLLDNFDKTLGIDQDLKDILKEAVLICDSVGALFRGDIACSIENEDILQQRLQLYLTSSIWLRFFANTPFKRLLYHFLNLRLFMSKFKKTK